VMSLLAMKYSKFNSFCDLRLKVGLLCLSQNYVFRISFQVFKVN
jgi:hypothetical protein